jgi:rare lipoprotein A
MKNLLCVLLLVFFAATAVTAQARAKGNAGHRRHGRIQYGTASFYANKFQGRATAGGELYDKNKMTCAHNSLPFGTWLKVTNVKNKRYVIVRVTDRLHHNNERVVDLSRMAALKLGYLKSGLIRVKVEILNRKALRL